MNKRIENYLLQVKDFIPLGKEALENFRIEFLGRKGILNDLFTEFKNIPNEEKKQSGLLLNQLKSAVQEKIDIFKREI